MTGESVLISGMGVAGPALAYWLLHYGFVPTLVERAPMPRTGGYIIDFWGMGYDITEKMGLLPDIVKAGYRVREVRLVNSRGRRVGGFDAEVFRTATFGRYTSLARGDLSRILYGAVEGRVETLFADSIIGVEQDDRGVLARFERTAPRRFSIVIGADGLHSAVRAQVFGPEAAFERFLGYTVAAFEAPGYQPRDPDVYVAYSIPGRQVARFAMRDGSTMILFVMADADAPMIRPHDSQAQKAYLRTQFEDAGWECRNILAAMDNSCDLYFDRVSQIRTHRWSTGRVALVGDAACAPSLLSGQGAALAIIGAYVLAGELFLAERPEDAFSRYERRLRPFMQDKQRAAQAFAGSFAPKTTLGVLLRNLVTKAFAFPSVARLALGSSLLDRITLPDYAGDA